MAQAAPEDAPNGARLNPRCNCGNSFVVHAKPCTVLATDAMHKKILKQTRKIVVS
jgi:hypothetical protein